MKKSIKIFTMTTIMIVAVVTSQSTAQDVCKIAPKNATLLTDTLGVRMIEAHWLPGEEMDLHTHPAHMIYVVEGGQLTVKHKGGKTDVLDLKPGMAMQAPPEELHTTKNTGKTNVKCILVEIQK